MLLGKVLDTFSATKESSGLPRPKVDEINLIEGFGIENDKFAGKDENRTVMIIGRPSYLLAKDNGIDLIDGSFGENILVDFDPHELEVGTIISIGDSKISITENCTICNHLAVFGKALPKLVKNHRGLYCKIISSGLVTKNQEVFIKE